MAAAKTIVPVFPLPNFFLFPGTAVPLHVFEPRYRQLVEDLLDGPGRLVMASISDEDAARGLDRPPFFPIGGLGEVIRHRRFPDGRFVIIVAGLARVHLEEVASERLYRRVAIEIVNDAPLNALADERLKPRLRAAIADRSDGAIELPGTLSVGQLADLLLHQLHLPPESMRRLFAERDAELRAESALAAHELG
jgi:Lon protease-like protein